MNVDLSYAGQPIVGVEASEAILAALSADYGFFPLSPSFSWNGDLTSKVLDRVCCADCGMGVISEVRAGDVQGALHGV